MNLLLDTHIYLWVVTGSPRLTATARQLISNAQSIHVSSASIWELAIKAHLGKLQVDVDLLTANIEASGFQELQIRAVHCAIVRDLPDIHRDPFDRILIAQTLYESLDLLTADRQLAGYPGTVRLV